MATYQELFDLIGTPDGVTLRNKVSVAAAIKAQNLLDAATPTTAEVTWANNTISDPLGRANVLLNYVLAKNNSASLATINAATDATIQTNVNDAADALIAGGAE